MQFATLKNGGLAVIRNEKAFGLDDCLGAGASMIDLITLYETRKDSIATYISGRSGVDLAADSLAAPVLRPSKIWAAAGNYQRGSKNLDNTRGRGEAKTATPAELLETIFLKPSSAVIGPGENLVIPKNAQTVFPELELGVVIGKECRGVAVSDAMDVVFGLQHCPRCYRAWLWVGKNLVGTRNVRKGFDTFAPLGPWIVTRDEIPDPQNLIMKLWVNDELRQSASTQGMINGVAQLVSYLSEVGTLFPGDLISSGNPDAPDFQQQLVAGDTLMAEIEGVGRMKLGVERE